jgi:hypothetical protein
MNESNIHCVETKPKDPGMLRGSFNWYSFREKEDRIVRRKLRELKPAPDASGVERLECRALVRGEGKTYSAYKTIENGLDWERGKAYSAYKTIENGLDWERWKKLYACSEMQSERTFGSNSLLLMVLPFAEGDTGALTASH